MIYVFKWFWGYPRPFRIAASAFFGVMLGFLFIGSPVWLIVLASILIFRTHLVTVSVFALFGYVLSLPFRQFYERAGVKILLNNETFWQNLCAKPFVNYLNLNNAQVLGSIVWALIISSIIFIILIIFLKKSKNPK